MKKWPIFYQNHGLTLLEFEKSQFFWLFEVVVFIAYKGVFYVLGYPKTHFSGLNCLKKKGEKLPSFDQNHGLNPLEESQFFDFLNFLFL